MTNSLNLRFSNQWLQKLQRLTTLLLLVTVLFSFELPAQKLKIHFIDIGQGDCILVQCPGGENVLIDCGSSKVGRKDSAYQEAKKAKETKAKLTELKALRSTASKEYEKAVYKYLDSATDQTLEAIVNTHPDKDHYNLLPGLLLNLEGDEEEAEYGRYDITKIITGGATGRDNKPGVGGLKFYKEAEYAKVLKHYRTYEFDETQEAIDDGEEIVTVFDLPVGSHVVKDDENDFFIKVVANNSTGKIKENSKIKNGNSVVLLIQYKEFKAITTGDATGVTTDTILFNVDNNRHGLTKESLENVSLLQIAHHGSTSQECNNLNWLSRVRPKMAISSNSLYNTHKHPRQEVFDNVLSNLFEIPETEFMCYISGEKFPKKITRKHTFFSTSNDGTVVFSVAKDGQVKVESRRIYKDGDSLLTSLYRSPEKDDDVAILAEDVEDDEVTTTEEYEEGDVEMKDVSETQGEKRKLEDALEKPSKSLKVLRSQDYINTIEYLIIGEEFINAMTYIRANYDAVDIDRGDRKKIVALIAKIIEHQLDSPDCLDFWNIIIGNDYGIMIDDLIISIAKDNNQKLGFNMEIFLSKYVEPYKILRNTQEVLKDLFAKSPDYLSIVESLAIN